MEKFYEDKLGYFDVFNNEYVIKNMYPKRPQENFLWNEKVAMELNQFGFGFSVASVQGERREIDLKERLVYILDKDTGEVYSPNRNYNRLDFDDFECHVGIGYHKVISSYKKLNTELEFTVPFDDYAVQYRVSLKNQDNKTKNLVLCFLTVPNARLSCHCAYGNAEKENKFGGLYYPHFEYKPASDYGCLYFAAEKNYDSYAVTPQDFTGKYGSYENPLIFKTGKLPSVGSCFEMDYIAAVTYDLCLKQGQSETYTFALATGVSLDDAGGRAVKYCTSQSFDESLAAQKKIYEQNYNKYTADLPDKYLEVLVNTWLKRQVSLGKTWARIWGKGFRDRMQDVTAFTAFDSKTARNVIIESLSYQRVNGNPIRMFEPIIESVYNDGAVWIPDAINQYIKESGDVAILDEVIPYLEDGEKGSVFEHIVRGLEYLTSDVGEHGLTLFRAGDWNDSTNGAGLLGKGESVWTSLATVRALKQFAELLEFLDMQDLKKEILSKADVMTENIMKYGKSYGHFIHGYDDFGNIIGGGDDFVEGSFCLNMQSWAVLADIGDKALQNKLMDMVEEKLSCRFGYKLSTPAYTKPVFGVGRTSYFFPGLYENASVYVHGNMFKACSDCLLGRSDKAYDTVCKVLYRNNPDSGVEPYAITNMFIGPDSAYRVGDAPSAWTTGSAGWMYRVVTEFILGVRADFDGLTIKPNIPSGWKSFSVKREYRGARYFIEYVRTNKSAIFFNGNKIDGNRLPVLKEGERANVKVEF